MGTRLLSWLQMCQQADPNFLIGSLKPWVYETSNGRLFYDAPPLYGTVTATLFDNGGVLGLLDADGWPTSPSGLLPGRVWDNNGDVAIVSGSAPQPGAPPVFYGSLSAASLLSQGAAQWPTAQPTAGSLQMWNNGGVACIA